MYMGWLQKTCYGLRCLLLIAASDNNTEQGAKLHLLSLLWQKPFIKDNSCNVI